MRNDFINAVFNQNPVHEILVMFKGRSEYISYTMNVFELLKTDRDTDHILDGETGEIIFER